MPNFCVLRALARTAVGLVVLGVVLPTPPTLPLLVLRPSTQMRPSVTATGVIRALRTGETGVVVLTVHNGGDVRAVVRRLAPSGALQQGGCRVIGAEWKGVLSLAAGASATQTVPVQALGQGCEGLTWLLAYQGTT